MLYSCDIYFFTFKFKFRDIFNPDSKIKRRSNALKGRSITAFKDLQQHLINTSSHE